MRRKKKIVERLDKDDIESHITRGTDIMGRLSINPDHVEDVKGLITRGSLQKRVAKKKNMAKGYWKYKRKVKARPITLASYTPVLKAVPNQLYTANFDNEVYFVHGHIVMDVPYQVKYAISTNLELSKDEIAEIVWVRSDQICTASQVKNVLREIRYDYANRQLEVLLSEIVGKMTFGEYS